MSKLCLEEHHSVFRFTRHNVTVCFFRSEDKERTWGFFFFWHGGGQAHFQPQACQLTAVWLWTAHSISLRLFSYLQNGGENKDDFLKGHWLDTRKSSRQVSNQEPVTCIPDSYIKSARSGKNKRLLSVHCNCVLLQAVIVLGGVLSENKWRGWSKAAIVQCSGEQPHV
jgi:hypothetical protein